MKRKSEIIEQLMSDWEDGSQELLLCNKIVNYVLDNSDISHITNRSLKRAIRYKERNDSKLITVLKYLIGSGVHLLDAKFEYIDDSEEPIDINIEDIRDAEDNDCFIHPTSGQPVENYKDKIFIYYQPSSIVKEIQK